MVHKLLFFLVKKTENILVLFNLRNGEQINNFGWGDIERQVGASPNYATPHSHIFFWFRRSERKAISFLMRGIVSVIAHAYLSRLLKRKCALTLKRTECNFILFFLNLCIDSVSFCIKKKF